MPINISFIKSLHKAAPLAVGAVDIVKDEMLYSSGHAETLLGYSREKLKEISKNNFESIVHPEDVEKSREAYNRLFNSKVGEIVEVTLRIRRSDEKYIHLFIRDVVFERNADQTPVKFTTMVKDISETVELEKQLKEKLEIIRKINYKNSHELRAPVANLLGLVTLMKDDQFQNEYNAKIFHYLEETVMKLDSIIHDINNIANY